MMHQGRRVLSALTVAFIWLSQSAMLPAAEPLYVSGSENALSPTTYEAPGSFAELRKLIEENERRTRELEARLFPIEPVADDSFEQPTLPRLNAGHSWQEELTVPPAPPAEGRGTVANGQDAGNSSRGNGRKTEYVDEEDEEELFPWYVEYDGGFVIRPHDEDKNPFELQINGRMLFRHTGFKRDRDTFTNRGGVVPVEARNDFEIERGRLQFEGFFYDPKLQFYINIDADTDDNHRAIFHDFWVNYEFDEAFNLHVGKGQVPGSRDWVNGSTRMRLVDRSLATTFFRPDRSVGVWATGTIGDTLHYHAMIANGFDTTDLEPADVDDLFAYSLMTWWEPLGDPGRGYSDLEWHCDPALRIGNAFTYSNQNPDFDGSPTPEAMRAARLSDGTLVVAPGALAPGVTVNDFDIYLYSVFGLWKYRGWGVNAEYYFRWLNNFGTVSGSVPQSQIYDDGFYVDVGYMIAPKKLEIAGRVSTVDGAFGDAWEYAAGVNWFVNGTHNNKVSFDITVLDGSPAQNSGPNLEVGQDGVLFRTQWQAAF